VEHWQWHKPLCKELSKAAAVKGAEAAAVVDAVVQ
jgi:hypothetical protein